ncbi:MAG: lipopolysaccharide kinase InaA family protein [Akkermansiaceae bacterium]|nr:lipopolysaccharide kinase InaA family protein [Akkermansiaceae bacterium]
MTPTENDLTAAIMQFQDERVNPDACDAAQAAELENISSSPPSDLIICKDGSRSLVGKHTLDDGTECVLKYYYPKNLAKRINYGLRGSRAMRSWIAAKVFSRLGIPTAAPMMIHEQKGAVGITIKQSFLACHLAPGIPLSDVSAESALQKIAPQLKAAFDTMTSYRISHGDLKANNIIVDDDHKIRFIDLDGTAILSSEKTWADLWKRDHKRFLKNWSEGSFAHQLFSKTMQPA